MVEELLDAAKTGDLGRVKYLIREAGLAVDSRQPPEGPTSLYWAACNGYVNVCSWLIDHRANPNFTLPKSGSTPLHAAADRGHHNCVLLLVCSGANINQQTSNNGDTSLHLAAYRGFSSVCSLLIDHGADVFILNKQLRTALDEAYVTRNITIVQMICKKHAELANIHKLSSKMTLKQSEESVTSVPDQLKEFQHSEEMSKVLHPTNFDFDDRIGIQQFAKEKSSNSLKSDKVTSLNIRSPSPQDSLEKPSEKHEIPRSFAILHSNLMEQIDRLTSRVEEKDRQLQQLKKENDKLKAELRKFTHHSY